MCGPSRTSDGTYFALCVRCGRGRAGTPAPYVTVTAVSGESCDHLFRDSSINAGARVRVSVAESRGGGGGGGPGVYAGVGAGDWLRACIRTLASATGRVHRIGRVPAVG